MTGIELVQQIAKEHGTTVNKDTADMILWEHTGFPAFFMGDPEVELRNQIHEYFGREDK